MDRYKRRDDGSHFDSQQARDSRGRFTSEPKKKKRAAELPRRPDGEIDFELLERRASERIDEMMRKYEGRL